MLKKLCSLLLFVCVLLCLVSCDTMSVSGTYVYLNDSYSFILEPNGTFQMYENGEIFGEENKRYINEWLFENDTLTLIRDEGTEYVFKRYGECFIETTDICSDYIAPSGEKFNYKIGNYEFFDDGTAMAKYTSGIKTIAATYYCEDNIIYYKNEYDDEYIPLFYIYDTDRIARCKDVLIKK